MRELIPVIEQALGAERLAGLRRDEDAYQDFWVGVLEAFGRVDWSRDVVSFLISSGYGNVRNARRAGWTADRFRHCPGCGRTFGYRMVRCPECGAETLSDSRHSELLEEPAAPREDPDMRMTIEEFVRTLSGTARYVARRWMVDRADLLYQNHVKQIAYELGLSAPRVSQIKGVVRREFQAYLNREPSWGH